MTFLWQFDKNVRNSWICYDYVKEKNKLCINILPKRVKKQPTKFDYDYEDGWTFQQKLSEKTDHNFT